MNDLDFFNSDPVYGLKLEKEHVKKIWVMFFRRPKNTLYRYSEYGSARCLATLVKIYSG